MDRYFRLCWALCIEEALRIYKAKGIPVVKVLAPPKLMSTILRLPTSLYLMVAKKSAKMDPTVKYWVRVATKMAMLQDLEDNNATEIDCIWKILLLQDTGGPRHHWPMGHRCLGPPPVVQDTGDPRHRWSKTLVTQDTGGPRHRWPKTLVVQDTPGCGIRMGGCVAPFLLQPPSRVGGATHRAAQTLIFFWCIL